MSPAKRSPKQPDISIVIPAYNEAKRIVPTILSIQRYMRENKMTAEIIVVDDASSDATELAVTGLADIYLKQPQNMGKGAAVRRGMLAATGKDALMMDADGSAPIGELTDLLEARNDAPIAIGSRHLDGSVIHVHQSLLRQTISYLGNLTFRLILRLPFADTQCGFKLFSLEAARAIFSQTVIDRWAMDVEILTIARILGYRVAEVPIAWHDARGSTLRAGRAAFFTFEEVLMIWLNTRMGKYKKKAE
jgi:dolichyl-phosphate beta-glucosyltransferase